MKNHWPVSSTIIVSYWTRRESTFKRAPCHLNISEGLYLPGNGTCVGRSAVVNDALCLPIRFLGKRSLPHHTPTSSESY